MRVLLPAKKLKKYGFQSRIFYKKVPSSTKSDFLILSKLFDKNALESAKRLKKENNTKVILDICDNKFSSSKSNDVSSIANESNIKKMLEHVDCVTVPTNELKKIFLNNFHYPKDKIFVIDDFIDAPQKFIQLLHPSFFLSNLVFLIFKLRIRFFNNHHKFIWFGASGKEQGTGLDALEENIDQLIKAFSQLNRPSLTIVSNSFKKYMEFKNKVDFKTFYIPWDNSTINKALRIHKIFILPSVINDMTVGKSSNRIITALSNNLEVCADLIPSYKPFANFINHPCNSQNIINSCKASYKSKRPDKSFLLNLEETNLIEWVKILKSL